MSASKNDWSTFYSQVNGLALSRYPGLLQAWFPAGQLAGAEFETGNLNGAPGKSLKINVRSGIWADFAGSDADKGSDPISLYAALHHVGQGEAGMRLGRELGIDPPKLREISDADWKPVTPIPAGVALPPARLPAHQHEGGPADAWLYMDAEGRPLMYRIRFERASGEKTGVFPLTWCENRKTGAAAWRWKDLAGPRPLYNLEKLAAAPDANVLVVEGEKTVDAAEALLPDWVVTTWPGGAKRAGRKDTDWTPLRARRVWVWPDADDVGKSAALTVAEILEGLNRR